MSRKLYPFWGLLVVAVALLNIVDVLPDWATFAAVLSLPLMTAIGCMSRSTSAARAGS
ncbi:hypothetical protein [Alteriqipengyuania sp. 357]